MRVMVIVKATEDSEKGAPPTAEAFEAMDRFTEELVQAGVMVAGAGLKPSAQAKRIAIDGSERRVIDGPFAETRELIAGFSIWEVKDMDEAVAWAKRCPKPAWARAKSRFGHSSRPRPAEFLTPRELSTPRDGERGKLGVALGRTPAVNGLGSIGAPNWNSSTRSRKSLPLLLPLKQWASLMFVSRSFAIRRLSSWPNFRWIEESNRLSRR